VIPRPPSGNSSLLGARGGLIPDHEHSLSDRSGSGVRYGLLESRFEVALKDGAVNARQSSIGPKSAAAAPFLTDTAITAGIYESLLELLPGGRAATGK
jgi:hypothetical protein